MDGWLIALFVGVAWIFLCIYATWEEYRSENWRPDPQDLERLLAEALPPMKTLERIVHKDGIAEYVRREE